LHDETPVRTRILFLLLLRRKPSVCRSGVMCGYAELGRTGTAHAMFACYGKNISSPSNVLPAATSTESRESLIHPFLKCVNKCYLVRLR
jgi:hypothetical protein